MTDNNNYKVYYYQNSHNKRTPVLEYVKKLSIKERAKTVAYIVLLRNSHGILNEPYSRYIGSGIRELRVDFSHNRHRVFYITVVERKIILLHAFLKKTPKTPKQEITRALNNFYDYKINRILIDYEKTT